MMSKITHYTDFLSDKQFIRWQLTPDDLSNDYWQNFIEQNPHLEGELLKAAHYLKKTGLNKTMLSEADRDNLLKEIQKTISQDRLKVKNRRIVSIIGTSVAAMLIVALGINIYFNTQKDVKYQSGSDFIVGNELKSEDIQLITGNKTATFQGNVDIQIQSNKKARIRSEAAEEEEILIDQHVMNKLIVPYGKRSEIILSDGTRAWLNAGSSLEFPTTFSGNTRDVFLSGEMYIEVAPDADKVFFVHTSGYDVKVYGTKFNVSSYSGAASAVVLVEGSVSLKSADKRELFIAPKELAVFSEATGTFETREVEVDSFISWKEGYLTFEDTPIADALKQIERYYNLSFNLDDDVSFKGLTCTGKIILSDNLDNVMTTLALISATKYKKEDKRIYIYKE